MLAEANRWWSSTADLPATMAYPEVFGCLVSNSNQCALWLNIPGMASRVTTRDILAIIPGTLINIYIMNPFRYLIKRSVDNMCNKRYLLLLDVLSVSDPRK